MLESVIESYIDTLREREFDAPFNAILHGLDFYDVHCIHGTFEFGKDFVAKRKEGDTVFQYAIQTKADSVSLSNWRSTIRGQLDSAVRVPLAHPSYDTNLRRKVVLCCTKKLEGSVNIETEAYRNEVRGIFDIDFEVWDGNRIIEFITSIGIGTLLHSTLKKSGRLLQLIGSIREDEATIADLRNYYAKSLEDANTQAVWSGILEWSLLAHEFLMRNRAHDSYLCANFACCQAWYIFYKENESNPPDYIEATEQLVLAYSDIVTAEAEHLLNDPDSLVSYHQYSTIVSAPVILHRALEAISVEGIKAWLQHDEERYKRNADLVQKLMTQFHCVQHPISDKYSVSVWAITLFLLTQQRLEEARSYIRNVTIWLVDRYVTGIGLGNFDSSEYEEIKYLIGFPFEDPSISQRHDCLCAPIILELIILTDDACLFDAAHNDFRFAEMYFPILLTQDTHHQFAPSCSDGVVAVNVEYPEPIDLVAPWPFAHHQEYFSKNRKFEDIGFPWIAFRTALACRDRIDLGVAKRILA